MEHCFDCAPDFMTRMFCGPEDGECNSFDSNSLLRRSWHNIMNHYAIVGITEDFEGTAWMLETLFPTFFAGMSEMLANTEKKENVMKNSEVYQMPSNDTTRKISQYLDVDEQLYEKVKKLYLQRVGICKGRG